MSLVDQLEWIDSTTVDRLPFMVVLDQDVQSVQFAYAAYQAVVRSSVPLGAAGAAEAAHHGKTFVTALHRAVSMLRIIQRAKPFACAASRLKLNLRKHATMFADYARIRHVIEHSDKELPIFPDVAPLMTYRDRIVLPIGVVAPVNTAAVQALLTIRRELIDDLAHEFQQLGADPMRLPRRQARVVCVGCGARHDLPFMIQPGHDADELCHAWVATPCPECKKCPSDLGVGGVGGAEHAPSKAS